MVARTTIANIYIYIYIYIYIIGIEVSCICCYVLFTKIKKEYRWGQQADSKLIKKITNFQFPIFRPNFQFLTFEMCQYVSPKG